jgi:hypothetical protein
VGVGLLLSVTLYFVALIHKALKSKQPVFGWVNYVHSARRENPEQNICSFKPATYKTRFKMSVKYLGAQTIR